ncbi:MAG TPA: multicopper oxidase domain-containing protein, partial [Pyrinomonadaceae bacterium]
MPTDRNVSSLGRREFMKIAGGSAACLLFSRAVARGNWEALQPTLVTLPKFTEPLPIPPVIDATQGGTFELRMAPAFHTFHSSLPAAPTWGYGGAPFLGPTFNVKRGVPISVNALNDLAGHPLDFAIDTDLHGASETDRTHPRASLHLHGGNTEPESDGHPEDTFLPGHGKTYHYANDQEAAGLWYHDHALGITRLNV